MKIMYNLESIATKGLKVGLSIQINKITKLYAYQRYYLTLAKGHSGFKIKYCFSQKLLCHQISYESLGVNWNVNLYK